MAKSPNWTEKEIELLQRYYPSSISNEKLLKKFPKRKLSGLAHKASRLGIKRGKHFPEDRDGRRWTKDEINMVRAFYGQVDYQWILDFFPNRTISGMKHIVHKYKPKVKRKRGFSGNPSWSEFEDKMLLKHYQNKTVEELVPFFPNRTYDGISSRIQVLRLKRDHNHLKRAKSGYQWTDEELEILAKNKDKPVKELAELLPSRSAGSIRQKLKKLD